MTTSIQNAKDLDLIYDKLDSHENNNYSDGHFPLSNHNLSNDCLLRIIMLILKDKMICGIIKIMILGMIRLSFYNYNSCQL